MKDRSDKGAPRRLQSEVTKTGSVRVRLLGDDNAPKRAKSNTRVEALRRVMPKGIGVHLGCPALLNGSNVLKLDRSNVDKDVVKQLSLCNNADTPT